MLKKILDPSLALYVIKKVHSHLFFYRRNATNMYLSDREFSEVISDKPARLINKEVKEMLSNMK